MASERRKGGAGGAIAGILEQPQPATRPEFAETEEHEGPAPAIEPAVVSADDVKAKPAKKRKVSRVSSKKAKVTGRTFYMHDSLYAMLRSKAIDRGETASECLTWIVEGYFKLRKKEPGEAGAGESSAA